MNAGSVESQSGRRVWMALLLVAVCVLGGCAQPWQSASPDAQVREHWRELLGDLRALEARIGFRPTRNFLAVAMEQKAFPYCGRAPTLVLPYSYQDPVIQWRNAESEAQCREDSESLDVFYGSSEALGEVGSPVTPSMLTSSLDRFVYLVIHEDCHDQFDLPYGIEEALCDAITYRAMAMFAAEKFRWYAPENRVVRAYAAKQSRLARETIDQYERVAALYARHERREITAETLLRERAVLFARAERVLAIEKGRLNNVLLANDMTYSRHYPALDGVLDVFGPDLRAAVAFLKRADAAKPSLEQVLKAQSIADPKSLAAVRAWEAVVMESIQQALAAERAGPAGR